MEFKLIVNYSCRILLSLLLSGLIGAEREKQLKNVGFRTIMSIALGATLITIFSLEYKGVYEFDAIRAIAYYLVAVGFGGNVISKGKGITTSAILLPICCVGFFCGMGMFELAIIGSVCIYAILMLKYIKIKYTKTKNKKR